MKHPLYAIYGLLVLSFVGFARISGLEPDTCERSKEHPKNRAR